MFVKEHILIRKEQDKTVALLPSNGWLRNDNSPLLPLASFLSL